MKHVVGTIVGSGPGSEWVDVTCTDNRILPHLYEPWGRAELEQQLGQHINGHDTDDDQDGPRILSLEDEWLSTGVSVSGSSGSGKTVTLSSLIEWQMSQGYSASVTSIKEDVGYLAVQSARRLGLAPEQVIPYIPARDCIPAWNPFLEDLPVQQILALITTFIKRMSDSFGWGFRLESLLNVVLYLVISRRDMGTSFMEVLRFLFDEAFRSSFLNLPEPMPRTTAYSDCLTFMYCVFQELSKSERASAIGPISTRIHSLTRSPYIEPMLCAEANTLSCADFWREQRLLVVHLDAARIGDQNARVLGGLLATVFRETALKMPGKNNVFYVIDEAGVASDFLAAAGGIDASLAIARSTGLRFALAAQFAGQLPEKLQQSISTNVGLSMTFRQSPEDARSTARTLALSARSSIRRVTVSGEKDSQSSDGLAQREWRHTIVSAEGKAVRLSNEAWRESWSKVRYSGDYLHEHIWALKELAQKSWVGRLYVLSADRGTPVELEHYVLGLTRHQFHVDGPELVLKVQFPKFKLTGVERTTEADAVREWSRTLMELPARHSIVRRAGKTLGVVRMRDVVLAPWDAKDEAFLNAAKAANCLSPRQIEETRMRRNERMDQLARGVSKRVFAVAVNTKEDADDPSLD